MGKALGLIEFIGYVPAICAADTALKAANVDLIGIEKVTGGIVTVKIRGDVDAVQAAIGAAENYASRIGSLRSVHVIPRLDDEVENLLMNSINTEEEIKELEEEIEDLEEVCEDILEETEIEKENLQEVIKESEVLAIIEDSEEVSEDKVNDNLNKESYFIEIEEISKMSVKELRKKIKSLNINITSNKLKSLKKKELVDILLKYNEEGDS
ncbi:BMC domain-containing protein [Clostridium cadaveris]|uniref:BMC domain-containing protein n=1 Tax=Clostridium cadaveris TaxID=1529 RepID=UPI0015B49A24|nr:BMC domain-containing protein [Clostridium cadaveris]NWK10724.1 BMC domain-containing protein [Clostridium cadaveris]UFH63777.1 BMC domain-containing protein [Clostridium cadaveris]